MNQTVLEASRYAAWEKIVAPGKSDAVLAAAMPRRTAVIGAAAFLLLAVGSGLCGAGGGHGSFLIGAARADALNPADVKTIHIKLRGNYIIFDQGKSAQLPKFAYGCSVMPPLPGSHSLLKDPGNAVASSNTTIDIYWSGSRLAVYTTGLYYELGKGCVWRKAPIAAAEIYHYPERAGYLLNYARRVAVRARGQYYADPPTRAADRADPYYRRTVVGHDVIAGRRCDLVNFSAGTGADGCVLSALHRFPNTGNYIELMRQGKSASVDQAPNEPAWIMKQQATSFEVNVPIPEAKFKVPAGFTITRIGAGPQGGKNGGRSR